LLAAKHFESLNVKQRFYAHHLSRACWHGTNIVLSQVSAVSPSLFQLAMSLFRHIPLPVLQQKCSGTLVTQLEWSSFEMFWVQFLGNLGNYLSFGDSKFIPALSESQFSRIIQESGHEPSICLWRKIKSEVYSLTPREAYLGLPPDHTSAYYTENVTNDDISFVQKWIESRHLNAYNTRLFKRIDPKTCQIILNLKIASAIILPMERYQMNDDQIIEVTFGDFATEMGLIVSELEQCLNYCDNENQQKMMEHYINSFKYGSIDEHKESQRWWVKDVSPSVESNLGFIESYRDPAGVRAEWEGFVAVVNKEQTRKFAELVLHAPVFVRELPWGKDFEKDAFRRPDFTSLEVLSFCTSGLPAGINIPKYVKSTFCFVCMYTTD
jgi:dipeptidyl-peptidase-3